MAESRLAVTLPHGQPGWHRLTIDVSLHTSQCAVSQEGVIVYVPHPRYIYRNCVRTAYHARNKLYTALYPLSPIVAFLLVMAVSLYITFESSDAWIRNSWYANVAWTLDSALPHSHLFPVKARIFYLSAWTSLAVILAFVFLQRLVLRVLLHYKGWLFDPPRRPSTITKVWAFLLKYVFMKRGENLTYSFQHALPRLPVPNLNATCEKYLRTVKPILSEEEYASLVKDKDDFVSTSGVKLQALLIARSWVTNNYLSHWWLRFVYLRSRGPLYINSNYFAVGTLHPEGLFSNNQVGRAANLIHCTCKIKQKIDREEIPPVLVGGVQPLCMYQYTRMFSTCRIPHREEDTLEHWDAADSRHVAVLYDGVYYKVNVYRKRSNKVLSPFEIQVLLQNMIQRHETMKSKGDRRLLNAVHLSALTTLDRGKWAELRDMHFETGMNHASINEIEKAICVVALDSASPTEWRDIARLSFLGNGGDRWCDKSLTYVVFKNGRVGAHVEHSFADAPVPSHFLEMIQCMDMQLNNLDEDGLVKMSKPVKADLLNPPYPLYFDVDEALESAIQEAFQSAQERAADLQLATLRTKFGKGSIKPMRMSPDAFIQMGLQLTYYRLHKKFVQTYESAMTRFYKNGRTETIRSCSEESCDFVLSMEEKGVSREERLKKLRTATEAHSAYAKQCSVGQGVDRHLFALYVVARGTETECKFLERALTVPWRLSTSQVPFGQAKAPFKDYLTNEKYLYPGGGFGPVSAWGKLV